MNAAGTQILAAFFAAAIEHVERELSAGASGPGEQLAHRAVLVAAQRVSLGADEVVRVRAIFERLHREAYLDLTAEQVPELLMRGEEMLRAGAKARRAAESAHVKPAPLRELAEILRRRPSTR